MERQWLTLDQIKAEYASNDYNPELLLQHLLHHVEARSASVPEGWKHSCNALCLDGVELWVPQCPHCGKPAPTPPASEDKDKIIAAANALENIASTSSSTRIRRVANDALTAIRARRN